MVEGSRWGDIDDDVLPSRTETGPDANGIRTIIEWKLNDKGNKVRITKQVKMIEKEDKISNSVLERKKWKKFGIATKDEGSVNISYVANEAVFLEDPIADQLMPGEQKEEGNVLNALKSTSIITCRHCGREGHWTLKCPFKDIPVEELHKHTDTNATSTDTPTEKPVSGQDDSSGAAAAAGASDKYVPPSMRGGAAAAAANDTAYEEESPTIRVTNISTDTDEEHLRQLFGRFGRISRIFLAKDRETMQSRGFAFVSFEYRTEAENAMNALQGKGYDHLILKLEWARPSTKKPTDRGAAGERMNTTFRSGYGKALPQMMSVNKR